ncbi:MAG: hypothetical protein GX230_01035 [Lentisphaerae bacterium]|jgi:LmbE family N-acetylglucosaminyl deacetylase|nr:hypothetical protein [Lentisphaerota bacterium]
MKLDNIKTFISIGAHCDDVEYRTGGLFSRLTRQGARGVYVVMVENPYVGSGYIIKDAATALATRRAESLKGAAQLGAARVEFFGFKSYYLHTPDRQTVFPAFRSREETIAMANEVTWYGLPPVQNAYLFPECVARLVNLITEEKPDLILNHTPNDRHPDHYSVGRFVELVTNDLNNAGANLTQLHREPGSGGSMGGWRPTIFFELSAADVERQQRAMECFPSQFPGGLKGYAERRARAFGKLAGVTFAEGYTASGGGADGSWSRYDHEWERCVAMPADPITVIPLNA